MADKKSRAVGTRPPRATKPAFKLTPLEDYVIVDVTPPEQVSPGGIVLPESAQKSTNRGTVVSVGPGTHQFGHFVPTSVKVGDDVLFEQFAGSEFEIDDKKYRIFHHPSIIAVVNK